MLKKLVAAFAIVVMSLSFSYSSFVAIDNGSNNVYASRKHHKISDDDQGFWQKIWDGIKTVQD
ncbi:hypothetical protein DY138_03065 [Apilactobacillus timberlakei]|uniref:hypothetical protein n=1 Tax=Apilactobacillus timberlakei TaxID=2008380 RepID=UPI001128247F|nr:hypothetical protein [Apilactobacillus timberlakei]TPR19641.1 hypothetical protein DY138_03065 [Apilactobacillus timberlakei]TPR20618.1 hypothetical protein DY061_04705 [Apilactobacillus timberlakei]TPR22661.1 hypothetical protein DY083_03975 [Apilactobacillus timberlakei]